MTPTLTEIRQREGAATKLMEIAARCEAATEGPWRIKPHEFDDWGYIRGPEGWPVAVARTGSEYDEALLDTHRRSKTDPTQHNADFIAHARTDIPYLLAEVERLRKALEQKEQQISDAETSLRIWDVSLSSEYWLRWDPTIRAASAAIGETGGE